MNKHLICTQTFSDLDSLIISLQILKNMVPADSSVVLIDFDVDQEAMRSVAARLYELRLTDGSLVYDIVLG